MAYNDEQLKATIVHILKFFRAEIIQTKATVTENNMAIFENHLKRIFLRDLPQFQPDKFELKKVGSSEPYFIEWIDKNILPFPENFSVVLSNDGNSFAMHGEIKSVIYSPLYSPNSSADMLTSSDSMSICSSSISPEKSSSVPAIKSASTSLAPQSFHMLKLTPKTEAEFGPYFENLKNNDELQQRDYFNSHYENLCSYLTASQKKEGKKRVFFENSSIDKNNIYQPLEEPKYVETSTGKTSPMYIPIYKKNKYGDIYRTMRATVADPAPTPVMTPNNSTNTELDSVQFEYEDLTNTIKKFSIS